MASAIISRALLSLVLLLAGVVHLVRPDLFDPAIPFWPKAQINLLAGVLECLLAIGLWTPKLRDRVAQLTALWFLILIPIHIYVSWNAIEIFGISHPALLWARTLLQLPLYFWALSLQDKGWLMAQRWSDVAFLHYAVEAKKLQEKVPFPLDLYQGDAVVSIVPFVMSHIRFPFLLPVPGFSTLRELNLRTYVRVNGVPAVYFFTLDSNHLPGVLIAQWFFALPYRWIKLTFNSSPFYDFSSPEFHLLAKVGGKKSSHEFDRWSTERYSLLTKLGQTELRGIVEHAPWELRELKVLEMTDHFSKMLGEELRMKKLIGSSYAERLDVRFRPFRKP